MNFTRSLYIAAITASLVVPARAQILRPVKWSYAGKKINAKEAEVTLTATIEKGWHIYAQDLPPGEGPIATSFKFQPAASYTVQGKPQEKNKPVVEFDPTFNKKIGFYTSSAQFKQRILLKSNSTPQVKGTLEYMVCSNSQCLPPETVAFSVAIK